MRFLTFLTLLSLVFGGCKTPDDALVGKPPEDELTTRAPANEIAALTADSRPSYPPPALAVATWPHADDRATFRLTWKGGNRALPLHEQPDPNSELLGEVVWRNGEQIKWQNSFVAVYQPTKLRAKEEWFAEGPVFDPGYQTDVKYVSETIRKGQSIDVYLYAGEGQCYLGLADEIFTGACPPTEKFLGRFEGDVPSHWYQPVKMVWWIQITDGLTTGWFPMDERVSVDIESA